MNKKSIPVIAGFDDGATDRLSQIPDLLTLQKMQELCFQGYSEEEAEEMCRPRELTDEEEEFIITQAIKQNKKEVRAWQRSLRKEQEDKMWAAISKKRLGCL